MIRLPMFPLGNILFPHQLLPLHVFEPRYREMTVRCLKGDRRFGVVLIERGHEVGGGDVRFSVGTVAHIIEAAELPDGRFLLEAVGRERVRVDRWLPDDPHPWADVTLVPEDTDPGPEAKEQRDRVQERLRQLLALRAELGDPAPAATVELDTDPVAASWEAAILAGLSPLDGLRVLETDGAGPRLALLLTVLDDEVDLARARLVE